MLSRAPSSGSGGRLGFQWALGGGPSNSFSSAARGSETGCSNVLYATWSSCPIASSHGTSARMSPRSWLGGNSPAVTRAVRPKHITRSFLEWPEQLALCSHMTSTSKHDEPPYDRLVRRTRRDEWSC